jgi:hypothetical protein
MMVLGWWGCFVLFDLDVDRWVYLERQCTAYPWKYILIVELFYNLVMTNLMLDKLGNEKMVLRILEVGKFGGFLFRTNW